MIHERALELAAALESGRFKQARGRLEWLSDGANCCLGVACRLTPDIPTEESNDSVIRFDGESHFLPKSVQQYFGFQSKNGDLHKPVVFAHNRHGEPKTGWTLTELNDKGATFTEIARIIRENWEVL